MPRAEVPGRDRRSAATLADRRGKGGVEGVGEAPPRFFWGLGHSPPLVRDVFPDLFCSGPVDRPARSKCRPC
jgi:hypothetical protein